MYNPFRELYKVNNHTQEGLAHDAGLAIGTVERLMSERFPRVSFFSMFRVAVYFSKRIDIKLSPLYDAQSGRCSYCGDDTLWGDAPHAVHCPVNLINGKPLNGGEASDG